MTFKFDTFSTNPKDIFDTMDKYGDGRSKQERVFTFLENIRTTNYKLQSEITFCGSNHNINYPADTNYLAMQIRFILSAQKPIQQKNCVPNKQNVSHVRKDIFGKTKY